MKLIEPSYKILDKLSYEEVLKKIERCGRLSYKSENAINPGSAERFIQKIIEKGHESVLEHFSFSVKFTTDRATSHQIVRHRIASFTQESQRYVAYDNDRWGGEIKFIRPSSLKITDPHLEDFTLVMEMCENAYLGMRELGLKPEAARAVLPNATATEIIVTANLREWRHILKLRTAAGADPEIKRVMVPLLVKLQLEMPVFFLDIHSVVLPIIEKIQTPGIITRTTYDTQLLLGRFLGKEE